MTEEKGGGGGSEESHIRLVQLFHFIFLDLKEFILRAINTKYFLKFRVMFLIESTQNI